MSKLKRGKPINDDIMKGIWVDGVDLTASGSCIIFDGIVHPPRAEEPTIVSRILFPVEVIDALIQALTTAQETLKGTKVKAVTGTYKQSDKK